MNTRELATILIRLHDMSQAKTAVRAGLAQQNISKWLRGQDNALSAENQLRLLDALGVRYERLRFDGIHQWCVRDIKDAALVLDSLLSDQEKNNTEIWHLKNSSHVGCIMLKLLRGTDVTWVLMYRPIMAHEPMPINAESLGCGKDMHDVIIDNATWESWLPPTVLEPIKFNEQISKLIDAFPYSLPPQSFFDEMENPGTENVNDLRPEKLWAARMPTAEEEKIWLELLLQAKLSGKSFDEIVKATRKAVGVSVLGSKNK